VPRGCRSAGDRSQERSDGLAEVIDPLGDDRAAKAKRDAEAEGSRQDQGNSDSGDEPPVRPFPREQQAC
jgi:hypothetical protein